MNSSAEPNGQQVTPSVSVGQPPTRSTTQDNEAQIFVASQWQLVRWRFQKHKVAMASLVVVVLIYGVALFSDFLAPYPADAYTSSMLYAPPQRLHLSMGGADGRVLGLFVYGLESTVDPKAFRRVFVEDRTRTIDVQLFARGAPYKLLGIFPADRHLIGPVDQSETMHLVGADRLGRDVLSRIIHGTRISMSIGLIGVVVSLVLGILLGGISGYYGGYVDLGIQRTIEFIRSLPTIPLWMGLAAALPMEWSPIKVYFAITVILSLTSWTGLARVVRGRFLALREEEFVMAAELDGAPEMRIIVRYMLPSFTSHIIASTTLAVPHMILSETSLSFLGLGLRPPVVSWGVLLKEAQSVRAVVTAPWLLAPAIAVVVAVLALNFLGDGLRDASDPYSR